MNNFDDFVGQQRNIFLLKVLVTNCLKNSLPLKHTLISGPPGTGKTFLIRLIAKNLERPLIRLQGNNLQRVDDINSILMNIKENSIIFIDEIHAINPNIEELLYSAMDEKMYSLFLGQGSNSKIINLELPSFSMVAATTKIAQMSKPLVSRFSLKIYFDNYRDGEIRDILIDKINVLKCSFTKKAIDILATVSKNNPRIAINTLEKMMEFANYYDIEKVGKQELKKFLEKACIYKYGLCEEDINYLKVLKSYRQSEGIGIQSLSTILNYERSHIEEIIEPFLLKKKLVILSKRGRIITIEALKYLDDYSLN